MDELFDRIRAAQPNPLLLTDDELARLEAWVKAHGLPLSYVQQYQAWKANRAGRPTPEIEREVEWRKHLRFVLEYNRSRLKADMGKGEPGDSSDLPSIPDRVRTIGEQYTRTCDVLKPTNSNPTDREVYDVLAKACAQSGEANELPEFNTWQRYLREWRKATGQQKNSRRAGRGRASGSLVPRKYIEVEHLPTSIRPRSAGRAGRGADD
jgi:hypothetical protein